MQCHTVRNCARTFFSSSAAKFKQVQNTIAGRILEHKVPIERGKKRQRSEAEESDSDAPQDNDADKDDDKEKDDDEEGDGAEQDGGD